MADRPPLVEAINRLQELADYSVPLTIRVICDLRVADQLAAGPRPVKDVALAVGAHPGALARALRALACRGVFTEVRPGEFGLTALSELLRSDHPLSLRDAYPMLAMDLRAWSALEHTIRTGEAAFPAVHGESYYDHLAGRPADSGRVDRSVEAQNRLVLRTVLSAYDWRSCGTLVDVGGGTGAFLAGILARYRELRGVLFDLPHVVVNARPVLDAKRVADRCDIVAGSFFDGVPTGYPTYLLKTILHDWADDDAVALLRTVRAAMGDHSRLLVLEAVLPHDDGYHIGKLLDLHSLVLVAGPDRSFAELDSLCAAADLAPTRTVETSTLAIIEYRPV